MSDVETHGRASFFISLLKINPLITKLHFLAYNFILRCTSYKYLDVYLPYTKIYI